MNGAEFVLRSLVEDGVDRLFLVPGGLVDPFLPAIARTPGLSSVVAAHEGGAAFMADGYARASGKFGAVLCIGGPGATNAVTAMSAAYTDHSPVLLLTGAVANAMQGVGYFQDATAGAFDDGRVLAPVTAESYSVPDVRLLPASLRVALHADVRGRSGARPSQHSDRRSDWRGRGEAEPLGCGHSPFGAARRRSGEQDLGAPETGWPRPPRRAPGRRRRSSPTTRRRRSRGSQSASIFRSPRPSTPKGSFPRTIRSRSASLATRAHGTPPRRFSTMASTS